jgi:hypothetical protein
MRCQDLVNMIDRLPARGWVGGICRGEMEPPFQGTRACRPQPRTAACPSKGRGMFIGDSCDESVGGFDCTPDGTHAGPVISLGAEWRL